MPDLANLARPGTEVAMRVRPGASWNGLTWKDDRLLATVTAPPEGGRANDAVRALLAKAMGVAPTRLTLVRGHKSRDKVFRYS